MGRWHPQDFDRRSKADKILHIIPIYKWIDLPGAISPGKHAGKTQHLKVAIRSRPLRLARLRPGNDPQLKRGALP
jgi:hypothetical protein